MIIISIRELRIVIFLFSIYIHTYTHTHIYIYKVTKYINLILEIIFFRITYYWLI